MSNTLNTVDNLISQVRSQLDEDNSTSVRTDLDILPALNRAQDDAMNILARHYEEPLLDYFTLDLVNGVLEYPIPEDTFEDRIEKLEIEVTTNHYQEMDRISYRDITIYESSLRSNIPRYYVQLGKRLRIIPNPTGVYDVRVWYLRCPPSLVESQGRINSVNEDENYIIVDEIGSGVSTEADQLESYVNLIDGQSGLIKGTFQVKRIDSNKVTFKTTPSRTKVINKTISTSLSSLVDRDGNTITVEPDDYICSIGGSCVPFFSKPVNNFLIQFAIAEITRKLGGPADMEEQVLRKFEEKVERSWVGREQTIRIKKRARYWNRPARRFIFSEGTFEDT